MDQQNIILYETKFDELCNIFSDNNPLKLKLFIKENIEFINNNNLIEKLSDKYPNESETFIILRCFYNLIKEKMDIVFNLKKWKDIYSNNLFWNLSTNDQIDFLNNLETYFLSIYDCSQGGAVYHIKLMQIFESNNYNYHQIMEDVEDRLKRILNLFGSKVFEFLKLPLITVRDLYNLSNEQILKYFTVIFKNIKQLLGETIELFQNFNYVCSKLDILLDIKKIEN